MVLTIQDQGTQDETEFLQSSQLFLNKHRQPREEFYPTSSVDRHFEVPSDKLQEL